MILGYPGGRRATLMMSLLTTTPGQARVLGSEGFIDILPRFHHPHEIVLHRARDVRAGTRATVVSGKRSLAGPHEVWRLTRGTSCPRARMRRP